MGQESGSSLARWFWLGVSHQRSHVSTKAWRVWRIHFWLIHTAVGRRIPLTMWTPAQVFSPRGFPQSECSERERAGESQSFLCSHLRNDIIPLLLYAVGHIDQPWCSVEGQCAKVCFHGGPPPVPRRTGVSGKRQLAMCSCVVFFFLASLYPSPHFCFLRWPSSQLSPQLT